VRVAPGGPQPCLLPTPSPSAPRRTGMPPKATGKGGKVGKGAKGGKKKSGAAKKKPKGMGSARAAEGDYETDGEAEFYEEEADRALTAQNSSSSLGSMAAVEEANTAATGTGDHFLDLLQAAERRDQIEVEKIRAIESGAH